MSEATVGRQYVAKAYDTETKRVSTCATHWSYGQAMNSATAHATQFPNKIVFLESRVVLMQDWEDVDFEAEERIIAEKRARWEALS